MNHNLSPTSTPLLVVRILKFISIFIVIIAVAFVFGYARGYLKTTSLGYDPADSDTNARPRYTAVDLGEFKSYLVDTGGRTLRLTTKVSVAIESRRSDHDAAVDEIHERQSEIADAINDVLLAADIDALIHGSATWRLESLYELKAAITRAINARVTYNIDSVFLKDFTVENAMLPTNVRQWSSPNALISGYGAFVASAQPGSLFLVCRSRWLQKRATIAPGTGGEA